MGRLDPLFEDVARLVVMHQQGSTSLIQRTFAIGYNRAGRIMGRATQGVRLINLEKRNDQIGSVCKVTSEEEVTDENSNTDLENITEGESGGTTNSDTNSDLTAEANSEE